MKISPKNEILYGTYDEYAEVGLWWYSNYHRNWQLIIEVTHVARTIHTRYVVKSLLKNHSIPHALNYSKYFFCKVNLDEN